jgi:cell division protein FtsW
VRRTAGALRALGDAALGGPLPGRMARWDGPATTYYVLQGAVLLLVGLGLVMVLSSSSVESLADNRSPFAVGQTQAVFAAGGLLVMGVLSRLPVGLWRRAAPLVALAAVALECLVFVPGLGVSVNGNRNWFHVGGFTVQPSELGKVAVAIWCAAVLAARAADLDRPGRWVVPVGLGAVPIVAVVLAGKDLGTCLVMALVVVACLFTAGVPLRYLAAGAVAGAVAVAGLVVTSASRLHRVESFLTGSHDAKALGWQSTHGLWALASGGFTGVGLGGSRQKWSWLPEAHNDFIFAIIGEELGLIGTLVVLGLFLVLGWCCVRVVRRSDDPFVQVLVGGIAAWVLGQAMVNIGVVIGVLPVLGLPLPLISAGGSALVCTLAALGVVLACARSVPGARAALRARPGFVRRSLAVVPLPRGDR